MTDLFDFISHMEKDKALAEITTVLGHLISDLDEKMREQYLLNLLGQQEGNKVSSMVHL